MNPTSRPANTFPVGSLISIDGVPAMHKLRIEYISDGCVTVYGKDSSEGTDHVFTISGSSPALPYSRGEKVAINEEDGTFEPIKERAERGSYDKILKNPTIPSEKFTIASFAETNGLPYPYALKWVKENCSPAGFAEKKAGQRGRAAELFRKL